MSDFTTYNSLIEQKIANTSEVFYTNQMKRQAANDTVKQILQEFDVPEMIVRGTLTIASGVATKPSDLFRVVKIWEDDSNNVELNEYIYLVPDDFDKRPATGAYFWTEDYNVSASARRLLIKPTTKTSLFIRYIKVPTTMSDDSTDSGLSSQWDEAVMYGSVSKLLQNSSRHEEAAMYERLFRLRTAEVYMVMKNPGGIKQGNRLKSRHERISQLGINTVSSINL